MQQQKQTITKQLPCVYKLNCDYDGEIQRRNKKKCALTRSIEHQEDSMTGKREALGATEHSKDCHGRFNWLHPKTLAKLPNITNVKQGNR